LEVGGSRRGCCCCCCWRPTCSHFRAASWDSYRDGLSTHQFGAKPALIFSQSLPQCAIPAAKRPSWRDLLGSLLAEECGLLGKWRWSLWRTLRASSPPLWMRRLDLTRGRLPLMFKFGLICCGARWQVVSWGSLDDRVLGVLGLKVRMLLTVAHRASVTRQQLDGLVASTWRRC